MGWSGEECFGSDDNLKTVGWWMRCSGIGMVRENIFKGLTVRRSGGASGTVVSGDDSRQ